MSEWQDMQKQPEIKLRDLLKSKKPKKPKTRKLSLTIASGAPVAPHT